VWRPVVSLTITQLWTKAATAGVLLTRPEGETTARQRRPELKKTGFSFFLCLGGD
jgi:hypothetical protein